MTIPYNTLLAIAVFAGVICLQIFLSKRERKFPGLVLPILSFLVALLFPLNMAMPPEGVDSGFVWEMIAAFLLSNIPTVILLAIYFACRPSSAARKKQLDKMDIQDLS